MEPIATHGHLLNTHDDCSWHTAYAWQRQRSSPLAQHPNSLRVADDCYDLKNSDHVELDHALWRPFDPKQET